MSIIIATGQAVLGIGLLTAGIGWFVALVWAKMQPLAPGPQLAQRIDELEIRLARLEENDA